MTSTLRGRAAITLVGALTILALPPNEKRVSDRLVPPPQGFVTPDGATATARPPNGTGFSETFTVNNTGTEPDTYELTCRTTGLVSGCSLGHGGGLITIDAGESAPVPVTYSTGSGLSGTLVLDALGLAQDTGYYNVPVTYVAVTPDGGTQSAWYPTTGNVATFTVQNIGNLGTLTYTLSIAPQGCSAPLSNCVSDSTTVQIAQGASKQVTVRFDVPDAAGTGTLKLRATGPSQTFDDGSISVTSTLSTPIVGTAPYNYDHQILGRCEASCFAATYAQSTVPYFTFDAPRSVTLVYHGDRMSPRPFIAVNAQTPAGSAAPQQFWLQAKVSGAWKPFTNGDTTMHLTGGTQLVRLAGQIDASTLTTGVYPLDIVVTSKYDNIVATTTVATKLVVVNENTSKIARGWTVAGVQRAYIQADSSVIVTEGNGDAVYFHQVCNPNCGSKTASPTGEMSVLTAAGGSWIRAYPDSTKVMFDGTGRMIRVVDRFGNRDTLIYDGSSRLWKVQDPTNRQIVLAYGTYGLATITDPMSRVTNVSVASDSTLRWIQDPDGVKTNFAYDGSRRLSSVTDRRGSVARLFYSSPWWKVVAESLPAIPINGGASQSPGLGFVPWQSVGTPAGSTASSPFTPLIPDSIKATVTDPEGHAVRFTVDRWGQALVTTDPLGRTTTVVRDGSYGMPTSIAYPSGGVESFTWDKTFLLSHTAPGQAATNFHYGAWAQIDSTWGTDQASQRMFLGVNGRVDSIRIGGQDTIKVKYLYDAQGRLTRTTDPKGHQYIAHYHTSWGNLDSTLAPGNRYAHVRFDKYGRDSATQTGGPFSGLSPWSRVLYDSLNRPIKAIVGPDTTIFTYDALFVTRVRDPKSQLYKFAYNALGLTTQRFDAADTTKYDAYRYDRDGLTTGWTNRRAQALSYSYDALHRVVSKSGDNAVADSFAYSLNGLTSAAWNAVARDSLIMNTAFQPVRAVTILNGHRFQRVYSRNQAGALDSVAIATDSGSALTFWTRKVSRNYWTKQTIGLTLGTTGPTWGRDGDGLRTSVNWTGTPAASSYTAYTSLHLRMTDSISRGSLNAALGHGYGYDWLMRIARETSSDRTQGREFTYDSLGRLTQVRFVRYSGGLFGCSDGDNGWSCPFISGTDSTKTFTYDKVGNRTDQGGHYTTGNRIDYFASDSFATDFDGNVIRKKHNGQNTYYYWSADGRLDSVAAGTVRLRYRYDAGGRLVRKSRGSATADTTLTYFLWEGDQLLAELNGTATERIAEYAYSDGIDRPLALITGATAPVIVRYFQQDGLSNVVAVVRDTFTDQKNTYDSWGLLQQVTGTLSDTNRMRWKGLFWEGDSTQMYYVRNRWYDPQTGRFTSEDPAGISSGLNFYTFAGANPIGLRDPYGLDEVSSEQPCPDGYYPTRQFPAQVNGVQAVVTYCEDQNGNKYGPTWTMLVFVLAPVTVSAPSFEEFIEGVLNTVTVSTDNRSTTVRINGNDFTLRHDRHWTTTQNDPNRTPKLQMVCHDAAYTIQMGNNRARFALGLLPMPWTHGTRPKGLPLIPETHEVATITDMLEKAAREATTGTAVYKGLGCGGVP